MPTKYQLHPTELITEQVGDRTDSLRQITWTYIAISEDNQYVSEFHHCTHVTSSNTSNADYISFADLEANTVLAWINNDLDNTIATEYESDLTLREYAQQEMEKYLTYDRENDFINHQMPWNPPPAPSDPDPVTDPGPEE